MAENTNTEREAFEKWAKERGYQRDELARDRLGIVSPEYFNLNTEAAWKAWQTRASLSLPAAGQEPVAWQYQGRDGLWRDFIDARHHKNTVDSGEWPIRALYLHPSPQEGMVGWKWVPVEPTQEMLNAVVTTMDDFLLGKAAEQQYRDDWAAMLAAAPPTSSADSRKGE